MYFTFEVVDPGFFFTAPKDVGNGKIILLLQGVISRFYVNFQELTVSLCNFGEFQSENHTFGCLLRESSQMTLFQVAEILYFMQNYAASLDVSCIFSKFLA